jgi:predicted ribosome quality control (RQC) complex YloA/Tae2 family protein
MGDGAAGILVSELRHIVDELQQFVGGHVSDAWVPTRNAIVLGIGRRKLLLEAYPVPRAHLVERRRRNPPKPFSFQGLLRARFRGRIVAIRQLSDDRILEVQLETLRLHVRLFGRGGGIWLLDADGVVAAVDGPADELPELPDRRTTEDPPRFSPTEGETWNQAAASWFDELVARTERERWHRHVAAGLKRALKRQRRLVRNLEGDLSRADGADALRRSADCLAAVLHTVRRGTAQLEVPDLFDDGFVEITLDPSRAPSDNLKRMYDKAGRLERAGEQILTRLDNEEGVLSQLESIRDELAEADLRRLRAVGRKLRLGEPEARIIQARRDPNPWWTWRGPGGETILVGRTAAGNRALTFKKARGRDWWFHLRDVPGAHVVLRRDQRTPPPLDLLLVGAQLVLHYARLDAGESADVQYARVADLRALPDAGVAGVMVTKERVLHVDRDPDVLAGWTRESPVT